MKIAFLRVGEGQPIVFASNFSGDVHSYQAAWSSARGATDQLVNIGWHVVLHDSRGMGASDREVSDCSLDARVRDLEAIVAQLGLSRFALAGADHGAATAITYAARNSARVSKLVLLYPWARGAARFALPAVRVATSAAPSAESEWPIFTNVIGSVATDFTDPDVARQIAESIQRSMSPASLTAYYRASAAIDVSHLLPHVVAPALIIHEPTFPFGSFDLCREVAAGIPDARLLVVRERSATGGAHDETVAAVDQFLRSGEPHERNAERAAARPAALTSRERQVLTLIAGGRSNRAIASALGMSERTVARHITNLYAKIGAHSKAAATAYAIRHGLT